jgi:hypothetical protein
VRLRWVKAPTNDELNQPTHTIVQRIARFLERQGLLERDAEHSTLALDAADEDPMVFAPNSSHRARVTPAKRGKGNKLKAPDEPQDQTPTERRAAMTPDHVRGRLWTQRLKRVFNIDIETCSKCGGAVKVIACIEDPAVIEKILAHLNEKALPVQAPRCPNVGRRHNRVRLGGERGEKRC